MFLTLRKALPFNAQKVRPILHDATLLRSFFIAKRMKKEKGRQHTTQHQHSNSKANEMSKDTNILRKHQRSNSEAHLSPPAEDRPLVEKREEIFVLSREEEKAV